MHNYVTCVHMHVCSLQTIERVLQQMISDAPPLELVYARFRCVMEDNIVQIILMRKTAVSYYSPSIFNYFIEFHLQTLYCCDHCTAANYI